MHIMSSRKRRICHDITLEETSSKRAKLLSTIWKTDRGEKEEQDVIVDTARSQNSTRRGHRKVKAIIGENLKEYLIEWEDLANNQKQKPSWKPKEFVDKSAIAGWINFLAKQYKTGRFNRKRRRENSVGQTTDRTVLTESSKSTKNRPQRIRSTPLGGSTEAKRKREQPSVIPPVLLPPSGNPLNFAVEISQHSSFDRDQYTHYQSSLSTQGFSSSLLFQDSKLGDSSAPPGGSRPTQVYSDSIVPDSKLLPGSSSYVPTSSNSFQTTTSNRSTQDHSIISTVEIAPESEAQYLSSRDSEHLDPIETSNSFFSTSRAQTNIPVDRISSTVSSTFSLAATSLTPVSGDRSDPSSAIATGLEHISTQEYSGVVGASALEIPASSTGPSCSSEVSNIESPDLDRRPRSRVPLCLHSQTTEKSSSVDNWQSGQLVPAVVDFPSPTSSESIDKTSISSTQVGETHRTVSRETVARRHPTVAETFSISEDHIDNTQTSQTTEESVLSQRNPNSQPRKRPRLEQVREEETQTSIDFGYLETEGPSNLISHSSSVYQTEHQGAPTPFTAPISDFKMSDQSPSQASPPSDGLQRTTLREKLLNLRAAGRAFRASIGADIANHDDYLRVIASPSPIPSKPDPPISNEPGRIEVQPMMVPVEIPLPVRAVQSQPHTPAFPSRLAKTHSFSQQDVSLKPIDLGESEYVIPLPMNTRVRDQYISTVNYYRRTIEDCIKVEEPDDQLKSGIDNLLFRVNAVTTHVDLDCKAVITNGRYTLGANEESSAEEARWAENCSAKFQFVGHLFEVTRDADILIAIVATSDHLLDIIETFLRGKEVAYTRPDAKPRPGPGIPHSERSVTSGRLVVTLLSSTDDVPVFSKRRANLVIAFDGHFNIKSQKVISLRENRDDRTNGYHLVPVIHLLVFGSGEHIERCLPRDLDPWARTRQIVSYITQTRHRVGQLQLDDMGPRVLAEEVAEFIRAGGLEKDWALIGIRAIDGLEMNEHNFESSSFHTTQSSDQSNSENTMGRTPAPAKRSIDTEARTSVSKKQKSVLADVTLVSDSMQNTQSTETNKDETIDKLRRQLKEAALNLDAEKLSYKSYQAGMTHYRRQLDDELAAEKQAHERTEKERQDIASSLNDLQTRMEDKTKHSRKARHEKEDLESTMATALNKSALQISEIATLKADRARLELNLKSARDANKASSNPSVAELETLKEENRKLKADNTALEKKITINTNDLEYIREQYQNASTAAAEASTRATKLDHDLAAMTIKAQGEAARLAEVNQSTAVDQAHAEVEKLRLENQMFETMLRRKEEELRELRRGRGAGVVTRGSSVVGGGKSPRGGSRAGSPGPGGVGFGGVGGKVGGSALRFG